MSEEITPVGEVKPIPVPRFNVGVFQTLATESDVGILCSNVGPFIDDAGNLGLGATPVLFLQISPLATKELVALLSDLVASHEAVNGELTSEFLKSRATP